MATLELSANSNHLGGVKDSGGKTFHAVQFRGRKNSAPEKVTMDAWSRFEASFKIKK